jgi:signal transduction histidine kinase
MVVASGLLALVVGATFLVLFFSIGDLRDAARDSRHSQEVLAAANRLERLVVDLETGQRGFLITHEERFLEPWATARAAFPDASSQLNRLAAVPGQDRRARQITEAVASYIRDYSVPLVAAARRNDPSQTTVAATDEGKRHVDALRIQFDGFIAAERSLGATRQERSDAASRRAVIGAATGIAGSIFLIVLYAGYLTRAIVRPVRRAAVTAGRLAGGDLAARMPETGVGEIRALERSFNTMGSSLEKSRDELIRLAGEQAALRRVATLVARRASPPDVFSAVAEELGRLLGADIAALIRLEPGNTAIVVAAWSEGDSDRVPVGTLLPLEGESVATMVLRTGRPVRTDSPEHASGPIAALARQLGVTSTVGNPIVVEGRLWGGLSVSSRQPEPLPTDTESRIADFAELVATAIANADARTELVASRARVVAAADETRRRLERDLHDGIQQRLVSLALTLRAAQATAPPELNELQARLSQVAEGLTGVLEELQEISRGIHPAILSEGGLEPAPKTLARRSAVPVELDVHAQRRLPAQVEVAAYYVVSEALTNAAKHANASVAHVDVEASDGVLQLSIRDDGDGGADPARGSGLIGLTDRVEALGGTIEVVSPPGEGTSLLVTLPVEAQAASSSYG